MDEIDLRKRVSGQRSAKLIKKISGYPKLSKSIAFQRFGSKSIDVWEVKNLSYGPIEGSKSSGGIARLSEYRKRCQDEALTDMDVELDEINQETERYIRYESDVLILKMRKHCSIYEAAAVRKRRPGSVMRAMSEDKVIEWSWENLMKNARSAIKRFHLTLQKVEKERVRRVKIVFQKYYQILNRISYLLPYDLQKLFQRKGQETNCTTLNNLRCYADLQKDLLLILARRMLYYKNEIIQHQRSSISLRPVSSFRVEGVGPLMKAVSSVDFSKTRDSTLVQIANLLARWQGQSTKAESELASSSSMEAGINFLSSIIQNMLSLYKQALMNVYTGVYDILASLHQDIQNTRIYKLGKRQSLIEEVFSDRATDHLTDAESVSIAVIMRLQTELKTLFRFLFDASEPWTYWTKRTEQATFLMRKLIRKTISQNAVMMIGKEAELNVLLDLLRQESSEEGLIQSLNSVIELLNDITKCYEESFDAEKSVIEQLYALGETQHNLLCIEVLKFQKKNPQDEFKAYHDMEPEPEEKSIYVPQALRLCEAQVETLQKWKYGFWEGIKFAVENAKQEIEETIEEWVNFLQGRALKRLEMRMMLHSPRYDRILTEILVVRQAELKFQSDRLDMHIQGVNKCLMGMTEKLSELVEKQKNDFKNEREKLEANWQENRYSSDITKISNLVCEVKKLSERSCNEVERSLCLYEEECCCKIAWLCESNHNFLQCIKLFSEGGSFSPEMAATLSQELESLNRVIAAHKGDLDKQIKNYKVSLPQQISQDVKAVTEEMHLLLTDLKFVDKVVRMVKQCQTNIKTEVFALKYKGKVLRKQASVDPDSSYLRALEQQSFLKDSSPWDSKSTMLDSRDRIMISKSSRAMFVSEMSNSSSRFLPSHSKLGSSFVLGQSKSQLPRNRSYEMSTFSSKEETVASESSPLLECPRKSSKDILFAKKTDFAIMTWNDLLNSILERRSCLLQTSTLASLVGERTKSSSFQNFSQIPVAEKKSMARLKVGNKSFHNYQGKLFGTVEPPASNSPSFMARIRSKLWDTFSKVQHVAAEYFAMKGSSPIIKTEFIQPTYKKFVEDILTRFQNYHQQCEEVWVQQVEDFMSLVVQVQDSVHNYEHRFAEEFHELKKEYIKKYLGAAALDLAEKLKENMSKLDAMEKKLMPLHGHPGNGRLLNALTTQANAAAVSMKEDLDFYVRKTKKEFHEEFIKICQQSKIAYGCLDNVLSELKSSEILKQLRAQKKSYLAAQKSMALQSRSTTVAIEPVPVDHRLSLDSQALNEWLADSEIQIPILKKMSYVSIDTKQSEMSKITERAKLKSMIFSSNEVLQFLQRPEAILEVQRILESIDVNIKEHVLLFKKAFLALEAQQSSFATKIEHWLNVWNSNVCKVQQLYSIELNDCQRKYKQMLYSAIE